MNYLVGVVIVGLTVVVFLRILALVESGTWAGNKRYSKRAVLRELLLGRRAS
jgi:hypothetical protein